VTGAEPEVWVRWKRVPNFLSSEPRSRHFTLESVTATLTFGDSTNGLIPPAGKDNLVMREFQTGGGEQTNLVAVALAIKELKTSFPFVDKVFNVQQAEGGSDSWSLEQTLEFGPQMIKNRGRAVTTEDYEWMVRQQFSQVARVRCLATRQPAPGGGLAFKAGAVTLIVVPKSSDRLPAPSQGLLKNIREFLVENTLGNIFSDIYVIGPDFEEVRIEATVVPKKPQEASLVVRRITVALEDFLHPLSGGENGQGWPFGRPVFLSEVFAVIERTEGVDHVESALFPDAPLATSVAVAENSLAASGNHLIHIL
jgi:predicted phage baseplate assembly protein